MADPGTGWIEVSVDDSGPGFDADEVEALFHPFQSSKAEGLRQRRQRKLGPDREFYYDTGKFVTRRSDRCRWDTGRAFYQFSWKVSAGNC